MSWGRTIASSIVRTTKVCQSSYVLCSTPRTLSRSYWYRCRLWGSCSIDWPISLPTYCAMDKFQSIWTSEWVTHLITYPSKIVPVVSNSWNCPHYLLRPLTQWFARLYKNWCSTLISITYRLSNTSWVLWERTWLGRTIWTNASPFSACWYQSLKHAIYCTIAWSHPQMASCHLAPWERIASDWIPQS